ncbi:MAG TPA: LytTR family DNA-binding domain-containing protein [Flavobacteriales bacterium]|nr:LytTR family DNA-binding domain-containing protein [Flavobacteriales bacterium]HRO40266.1 LytTR family DNA-binding domain-containing protein [Flavobacteriales bacterium]HRP82417.1 LytTR family DNA-binding domain-containing protein [Flavobacteriales bacterium]HRQ83945.1 LytTR family DNA-binding domain-containing protein [Flavobacteriales bacterium]
MATTAVIVDDEAQCRETLASLLAERHPGIHLLGVANDVPSGTALVRAEGPDVLFLDVEMGRMTGFDLLKAIAPKVPHVIFTTAHESYAVRAIRFSAVDYLLKPIVPEELDDAVNKAVAAVGADQVPDGIPTLLGNLAHERQIALPTGEGLSIVLLDDILYCNSDNNYTEVYVRGEKRPQVVSRPLSEFAIFLLPQGFVRIHQSHLVNRRHIKRYVKGEGGEVVMCDGMNLPVSRRQKPELMEALGRL